MSDDRVIAGIRQDREERMAAWVALDPGLDLSSQVSKDAWAAARESFFSDPGPIPVTDEDRDRLSELKDRYRGERIFIIGNGPSLNRTPMDRLADEFTFGVNRIYLMFDRLGWKPTFYTTVDWRVAPDVTDEINALEGMHLFFPERFRGLLRGGDDVTWYWNDRARHRDERGFATDASLGIRGAGSVSGAAIQLAFHMGFDPIHIIGCDVSYSVADTVVQDGPDKFGTGVGLRLTSTDDDDANHFDKRYFGAGRRWHDPNVERMIEGFTQCNDGVLGHGRSLTNATVGGNLEVIERTPIRSLFARGDLPSPVPTLAAALVRAACPLDGGLMLDIGAGAGRDLQPFASTGWRVWAVEPDAEQRTVLHRSLPPSWDVMIDARAVDSVEGARTAHRDPGLVGVALTPWDRASTEMGDVPAVTPAVVLEPVGSRSPDVVCVGANGWEAEILGAWPFDEHRPAWFIVQIDDRVSPRLGFTRRSIASMLQAQGYAVVGVDGETIVDLDDAWLDDASGGAVALVGCPATPTSEQRRFAALLCAISAAEPATVVAAAPAFPDLRDDLEAARAATAEAERALANVTSSTSWKLGSRIVQTLATIARKVPPIGSLARRIRQRRRR